MALRARKVSGAFEKRAPGPGELPCVDELNFYGEKFANDLELIELILLIL